MNEDCCIKAAGSAVAGVIAILLPKCPLCIAAWIAASTGIALPGVVAGSLRPLLATVCVLTALLLIRRARRPGMLTSNAASPGAFVAGRVEQQCAAQHNSGAAWLDADVSRALPGRPSAGGNCGGVAVF
jgi:hypothetical protein